MAVRRDARIAGAVGGVVLSRTQFGGALLVALVIVGASIGITISLLRGSGPNGEPLPFTVARWSSVFAPAAAGATLLFAWAYVRRRRAARP